MTSTFHLPKVSQVTSSLMTSTFHLPKVSQVTSSLRPVFTPLMSNPRLMLILSIIPLIHFVTPVTFVTLVIRVTLVILASLLLLLLPRYFCYSCLHWRETDGRTFPVVRRVAVNWVNHPEPRYGWSSGLISPRHKSRDVAWSLRHINICHASLEISH